MRSGIRNHALIAMLGLVAVLVAMLAIQEYSRYRQRVLIRENSQHLRSLHGIMQYYFESVGKWPPAVNSDSAAYSWRVSIAEYYPGIPASPVDVSTPWHAPDNAAAVYKYASVYRLAPGFSDTDPETTHIMAVQGDATAWDPDIARSFDELPCSLVLCVTVRQTKTVWPEPGDLAVDAFATNTLPPEFAGQPFAVLFADGEVRWLVEDTPPSAIRPFLTVHGATTERRADMLDQYTIRIVPASQ